MTRDHHRHTHGPQRLLWRKSSFSTAQGECVEVATRAHASPEAQVLIRDSKHPTGGHLTVTHREWAAFLTALRAGEFD